MTIDQLPILSAASVGVWDVLLDILILLTVALLMGAVAERLGQSVIVGYLISGALVGPNGLGWVSTQEELFAIAELGVALLLFAIGLEFSPRRLLVLGNTALKAGPFQVVLTSLLGFGAAMACGCGGKESLVIGMIIAMSSTACVLRMLNDRAEIDSQHGRTVLGILLVQDVAVVPMMLLVSVMSTGGRWGTVVVQLAVALVLAAGLIGVFYAIFNIIVPRILLLPTLRKNRDLPVLLAVIMATGSAWAAHAAGLSPALGAFAAGVLLAMSPFATQIRADSQPLTTLMVTLFFTSIGMFGDPVWLVEHWLVVMGLVLAIVVGKPLVIALLSRAFGQPWRYAIATGICLAQVGEFSFVLAVIAHSEVAGRALIDSTTFRLMVSAALVTLLFTPYLIAVAPWAGSRGERLLRRIPSKPRQSVDTPETARTDRSPESGLILIIGFGPAGQRVAEGLLNSHQKQLLAVDLNKSNIEIAERYGIQSRIGDATQQDILDDAGIHNARAVVLTVPDHATTRHLIYLVRDLAPGAFIVARCRYHVLHWELLHAGAHMVVDEEDMIGRRLAAQVRRVVGGPEETVD